VFTFHPDQQGLCEHFAVCAGYIESDPTALVYIMDGEWYCWYILVLHYCFEWHC
jgi:hypothetical protein